LWDLGLDSCRRREQLRALREQFRVESEPVLTVLLLAQVCEDLGEVAAAEEVLRRASAVRPDEVVLLNALGKLLEQQGRARLPEAIECYRAIRVRHRNLGVALAAALGKASRAPEAEAVMRDLVRQQPGDPSLHLHLGFALDDQKKWPEAEAAFRKAILLQPAFADGYYNLGNLLRDQKKMAEAEAAFRKAILLKPAFAEAHNNLGLVLQEQKKPQEAEAAYRKALLHKPALAAAHGNLGNILYEQKKLEEAEAAYRKAISLQPDLASVHFGLGGVLREQKKMEEAEAAYRKVTLLWPDFAEAHCALGLVLRYRGRLVESLESLKRGHQLGSRKVGWPYPSFIWVHQGQHLLKLAARLSAVLEGSDKLSSAVEQLEFAHLCQLKELCAAAARLYRDAFAADPKLAQDVASESHYSAACCAARAGCGQGKDADSLDDKQRGTLRQQAHDWLEAALAYWSKVLDKADAPTRAAIAQRMQQWRSDPELAGVRDKGRLARLPEAERTTWRKLWDDVAALRQRAASR
jgi:superkiller protein 3